MGKSLLLLLRRLGGRVPRPPRSGCLRDLKQNGRQIRTYHDRKGILRHSAGGDADQHIPDSFGFRGREQSVELTQRAHPEGREQIVRRIRRQQGGRREMERDAFVCPRGADVELVRFAVAHHQETARGQRIVVSLDGIIPLPAQEAIQFVAIVRVQWEHGFARIVCQRVVQHQVAVLVMELNYGISLRFCEFSPTV